MEDFPDFMQKYHIDFENAQNVYDGIYLTEKGQEETHIPFIDRGYNLHGWDCECCLILNPYVIKQQMSVLLN